MKGFSATIDLGCYDCCAIRRGSLDIEFQFWIRQDDKIFDTSVTKAFRFRETVEELFYPKNRNKLQQEALQALTLVQQTFLAHGEEFVDGEPFSIVNPRLES